MFSSSNTSVATVDGSGNVWAEGPGTAVITVRTARGGYTDTCEVTVNPVSDGYTPITLPGFGTTQFNNTGNISWFPWTYTSQTFTDDYQLKFNLCIGNQFWHWTDIRFAYQDENNYYQLRVWDEGKGLAFERRQNGAFTTLFSSSSMNYGYDFVYNVNMFDDVIEVYRELPEGGRRELIYYSTGNTLKEGKLGMVRGEWDWGYMHHITVKSFDMQ